MGQIRVCCIPVSVLSPHSPNLWLAFLQERAETNDGRVRQDHCAPSPPTRDYLGPVISDGSTFCDMWVQEERIAVTPPFTTTMWNSTGIRFMSSWHPLLYWLNCWGLGKFYEDSHSKSACRYQRFITIKYVSLQQHENSSYVLEAGFLSSDNKLLLRWSFFQICLMVTMWIVTVLRLGCQVKSYPMKNRIQTTDFPSVHKNKWGLRWEKKKKNHNLNL